MTDALEENRKLRAHIIDTVGEEGLRLLLTGELPSGGTIYDAETVESDEDGGVSSWPGKET